MKLYKIFKISKPTLEIVDGISKGFLNKNIFVYQIYGQYDIRGDYKEYNGKFFNKYFKYTQNYDSKEFPLWIPKFKFYRKVKGHYIGYGEKNGIEIKIFNYIFHFENAIKKK